LNCGPIDPPPILRIDSGKLPTPITDANGGRIGQKIFEVFSRLWSARHWHAGSPQQQGSSIRRNRSENANLITTPLVGVVLKS
jgi:hypothetical protein